MIAQRLLEAVEVEFLDLTAQGQAVVEGVVAVGVRRDLHVVAERGAHPTQPIGVALDAVTDLDLEGPEALLVKRAHRVDYCFGLLEPDHPDHADSLAHRSTPDDLGREARALADQVVEGEVGCEADP